MIYINYDMVRWFSIAALFFFWGGATHLFSGAEGTGTGVLKVLFYPLALIIYFGGVVISGFGDVRPKIIETIFKPNAFSISLLFIIVSVIWSYDPLESFRRIIALIGTTLFGVAVAVYFGRDQFIILLRDSLFYVVICSVLLALLVPNVGTHVGGEFDGLWKGALSFKNQAGWLASLFCLIWLYAPPASRLLWLFGLMVGFVFLLNTGSATGFISFLFGLVVYLFMRFIRVFKKGLIGSVVVVFALAVLLAVYVASNLEYLLGLLGKDLTLTGRLSIWLALIPYVSDKLLIGYGYSSFWPNVEDFFGYSWMAEINHAHNGFVELLVDLGVLGLFICSFFLVAFLIRITLQAIRDKSELTRLSAALWAVCMVIGMSGKVFYVPNSGIWVMLVGIYVSHEVLLKRCKDV